MSDHQEDVPLAEVPPSVAMLRLSLTALIEESKALRTDVKANEAARKRENHINMALLGLLAVFIAMVFVVAWQNNNIAQDTRDTNARMADCTTPGGRCYSEGSKRTGDAIGNIIRAEVYMAECTRLLPGESGPEFDKKLEQCVVDKLAHPAALPPPSTPTPTPSTGG